MGEGVVLIGNGRDCWGTRQVVGLVAVVSLSLNGGSLVLIDL